MKDDLQLQAVKTKSIIIELPLPVNTYDIDVAGHVNNIVYIRWLEDLRNMLFSKILSFKKLLALNHYFVVASSDIKYKKMIKLFDKPVGKMLLQSYSHGVFVLQTEIILDDSIAFTAIQKCVLINLADNKMVNGNLDDVLINFKE